MVLETCLAKNWDILNLIESLNLSPVIPIEDRTALLYVANFSQRQYQMSRNILVKYGINSPRSQNDTDSFEKNLYPSVMMKNLSASANVESLSFSISCNNYE